ncbi:unnamed protein product [Closterium sp. NIES-65]|nr:unnamed protein product [Closterium sp. NIES-65]
MFRLPDPRIAHPFRPNHIPIAATELLCPRCALLHIPVLPVPCNASPSPLCLATHPRPPCALQRIPRPSCAVLRVPVPPVPCCAFFSPVFPPSLSRFPVVAFVGDSFSRNVQQAIACELGVDDHVEPWSGWLGGTLVSGLAVPRYNLKLVAVVAPYLVRYSNQDWAFRQYGLRPGDGSRYVVWLDHMDDQWAAVLQHVDLAVFMSGHWFLDKQGAEAVRSTVYVANNRVVRLSGMSAYRAAIRSVKRFVTVEQRYRGVPMWLTYSPSHYSRGNPPTCRHTTPISTKRVQTMVARDISTAFRRLEVRELKKSPFRIIDITRISLFRPDAHVKRFYGAKTNSKTKWDCTHWCLPGLPDVWADIFQFVLKTQLRRHKK